MNTPDSNEGRKYPKEWYTSGKNPFLSLKEYWYQQYVKAHPDEFGFTNLEGPFDTGPDFAGTIQGKHVRIEVERDYLSYFYHGHPIYDVLVVGVLEQPHSDMVSLLPPIILHLDPHKVLDWSKPMRQTYREEMDKRRETLPQQLEWVQNNSALIKRYRITKDELVQFVPREQAQCECGGVMLERGYTSESDGEMTEGQLADYEAGFWKLLECQQCGENAWLEGEGGDISV